MRRIILGLVIIPLSLQAQTLEECQRAAERNYPLIRQYDLIAKTTDLTVANIADRLRLIYGGQAGLAVFSDEAGRTVVRMDIPQDLD